MAKLTYSEQLKHPNWQRRRLEIMEAAGFECESCGDKETTLNVHHKRYIKGRMAWEYEREELECLCEPCHEERHSAKALLDELLARSDAWDPSRTAVALLGGWLAAAHAIDAELAGRAETESPPAFALGIVAFALATSSRYDIAKMLLELSRNEVNGPIIDRLIERWSKDDWPAQPDEGSVA